MEIEEFDSPYYHAVIDGFLADDKLDKLKEIYYKLSFREIQSDLFHFFQTNELNNCKNLDFFNQELDFIFKNKSSLEKRYYTTFASYYKEGNYLLCHDDLIDDRLYAFTYYLNDYTSGELIIYENDCKTVSKSIEIKKNRLVIFKVGSYSFHEVANCKTDGREAITGWFNIKDLKAESPIRNRKLTVPENIEYFDLPVELNEDCICLEFEDIHFKELERVVDGPFTDRRAIKINIEKLMVPRFEGYELISAEYIDIPKFGYILSNDRINDDLDGILDVFIFVNGDSVEDFISYVEDSGEILQTITPEYGSMIISQRKGRGIIIQRSLKTVEFKHFIYKKRIE